MFVCMYIIKHYLIKKENELKWIIAQHKFLKFQTEFVYLFTLLILRMFCTCKLYREMC